MITYYLNTTDEAAMRSALLDAGAVTDQDGVLTPVEGVILDIIGEWWKPTGEYTVNANGEQIAVMTKVDGWYFNIYSENVIEFPPSVTQQNPTTPWRVLG